MSGLSNSVWESPDGRVFRRALTTEARSAIVRQFRFLPWLAQRLQVPVPIPESLSDDVLVYRKLPGVILSPALVVKHGADHMAEQIAEFISALQALPIAECKAAGIIAKSRTGSLLSALDRTLPALSPRQRSDVECWRDRFTAEDRSAVLIHGDLWYGNILIDSDTGRLCGVLDFDTMSIGDSAWDLAAQLHLGKEFARLVLEKLPVQSMAACERAKSLFQLRCFEGLDLAIRRNDRLEFEESIGKLRSTGVIS